MADFRKWLFAFALVALLIGASMANAQPGVGTQQSAFTCVANAGTPVIVRVEGITELVGDLLLQCTGGQPTPAGSPIPAQNVTLTLNTNITSPLVSGGYIDALLLIDDPYANPADPAADNPPTVAIPPNSPQQHSAGTAATGGGAGICQVSTSPVPGQCNYLLGTSQGNNGPSTAYGGSNSPYLRSAQSAINGSGAGTTPYTMYAARPTSISGSISGNQVTWLGVPIDAPGSVGVRVVRLTNVRANACQLGLSSTLIPTQIVGFVSITGSQFVTINNPQQTLAYIQQGLIVSGPNSSLAQCTNLNVGGGGVGGNFFGGSTVGIPVTSVTLREGFAQSFKVHQFRPLTGGAISVASGLNNVGVPSITEVPQDVPGFAYNSESGFQPSNTGADYITYAGGQIPGIANSGTRFLLRFNNVGAGARLVLPVLVPLVTGGVGSCSPGNPAPPSAITVNATCNGGNWTGGFLQLIGTSSLSGGTGSFFNGFGAGPGTNISPTGSFNTTDTTFITNPLGSIGGAFTGNVEVTFTAPTAAAVYEVINADPAAIESATIPIGVAFTSNTPNNLPALGQVTLNASFAPLSTVNTASSLSNTTPVPRFCDRSTAANTFIIQQCVCNLLFPFVTQAPGFDTGIAIANTSLDNINGVTPETGTVRMDFYGTTTGGAAVSPASLQSQNTTVPVPAGQVLTYTLFGGAGANATGLQAVPGFTGYIVAQAKFRWCHGFAFISDLGAQRLAEGYLAIQLDIYAGSGLNRTGVVGEVQGH